MQTLNRYVGGRQEVGHIDLFDTFACFEVPEKDARKVMTQLTGIRYKDVPYAASPTRDTRRRRAARGRRRRRAPKKLHSIGKMTTGAASCRRCPAS